MSRAAEKLLSDFHSREPREAWEVPTGDFPAELPLLGEPIHVVYESDKRDPGDPEGRGRQGVPKLFIHEHDRGRGLELFGPPGRGVTAVGPFRQRWPAEVVLIGYLREILFEDADGKQVKETFTGKDWKLWAAAPNGRILIGLRGRPSPTSVFVWRGGNLKTTWRGIEG